VTQPLTLVLYTSFTCLFAAVQISALRYVPDAVGWQTVGVVLGVAVVCFAAAVFISRQ